MTTSHGCVFPKRCHAFTEHGVLMLANVLNSERAIRVSVQVVRAFIRLRQDLGARADLEGRVADTEKKYDAQFKVVFDAIRQLMTPPSSKKKEIGFRARERRASYRSLKERRRACGG